MSEIPGPSSNDVESSGETSEEVFDSERYERAGKAHEAFRNPEYTENWNKLIADLRQHNEEINQFLEESQGGLGYQEQYSKLRELQKQMLAAPEQGFPHAGTERLWKEAREVMEEIREAKLRFHEEHVRGKLGKKQ